MFISKRPIDLTSKGTHIFLPGGSKTRRGEFLDGWAEEVDEGGCDDDTGTKIFCESGWGRKMRKGGEGGGGDYAYSKMLWGREMMLERRAMTGKVAPAVLQTQIIKTDAMRRSV